MTEFVLLGELQVVFVLRREPVLVLDLPGIHEPTFKLDHAGLCSVVGRGRVPLR